VSPTVDVNGRTLHTSAFRWRLERDGSYTLLYLMLAEAREDGRPPWTIWLTDTPEGLPGPGQDGIETTRDGSLDWVGVG